MVIFVVKTGNILRNKSFFLICHSFDKCGHEDVGVWVLVIFHHHVQNLFLVFIDKRRADDAVRIVVVAGRTGNNELFTQALREQAGLDVPVRSVSHGYIHLNVLNLGCYFRSLRGIFDNRLSADIKGSKFILFRHICCFCPGRNRNFSRS